MKKILTALVMMIICVSSVNAAILEGQWGAQQKMGGINFDTTFSIGKSSVTVTNLCTGFGTSVTAEVTVAAMYTDHTLTILESRQDQKSNGPLNCQVGAQQDTMNYSIQGNQLILTHANSADSFILIRK